jgi:FkbM family methyltransferase
MSLRRFIDRLPKAARRQKLLVALVSSGLVDPVQLLDFDDGGKAWVDLRDGESRANYLSQTFWPELHPIVAAFLREGGDLFDIGANFGLVTFGVLARTDRKAAFHLFEANPDIIPTLERSALEWPDASILVHQCCVTDAPGTSLLTLPDGLWGHAFIGKEGTPVSNLVLDEYIRTRSIQRVSFLKLDVNGPELQVIRGAAESYERGIIGASLVEVVPSSLAGWGATAEDLFSLMDRFGFDGYFCGLWERPDPYGLSWARVDVHGTTVRFAMARPLPAVYTSGDVLFVHRTTEVGASIHAHLEASPR